MIPVILSGGSGSRLWPISRSSYPKQFCDLFDEPLLTKTIKRLSRWGAPYAVTVQPLNVLTEKCFRSQSLEDTNIIYEPEPKNTGPAIALLCAELLRQGKGDELVGVFPADHMIQDEQKFHEAIQCAVDVAKNNFIVTVGIEPSYPATGFGYIECSDIYKESSSVSSYKVNAFREKPDIETAKSFIEKKNFYWNAGMFIFKVSFMVEALKKYAPEIWTCFEGYTGEPENIAEIYGKVPSDSIDYAVMEKEQRQVCVPCDIGWSDLGSWDDLAKLAQTEGQEGLSVNSNERLVEIDSKDNFVVSSKNKIIGLVGVEDLIVIETPDALLISKKGESQKIKSVVNELKNSNDSSVRDHLFDFRPWGKYEILSEYDDFKVKIITVNAGAQLSYQSHKHRKEHWVVLEGEGEVILNDRTLEVFTGSSIVIPTSSKHRIRNTGKVQLRFVEVQTGDYFGEDDIVRYEDDYKRV